MSGTKVIVQDDNVEKALRKLKKKVADSGLLLELQKRQQFTKPSVQKKLELAQAKKRWIKYIKSQQLPPKEF